MTCFSGKCRRALQSMIPQKCTITQTSDIRAPQASWKKNELCQLHPVVHLSPPLISFCKRTCQTNNISIFHMYTSIFIEAVQNVTCELKMQSVLKLTYLFMNFVTHAFVFQYSVILNFVFQPVFERACLQLMFTDSVCEKCLHSRL